MSTSGDLEERELSASPPPEQSPTREIEDDEQEPDEEALDGREDDDEDEDEEDDEDEDDVQGRVSRKRRKLTGRNQRNQYIDMEAEVDEDDEEDVDDEDDLPGDEVHPDDLLELPPGAERDDRAHRELDRRREADEHIDAEAEAQRLKERYGRQQRVGDGSAVITDQRLLLPSGDDPRIFRMKCRPGKEREIIMAVHQRIIDRTGTKDPIRITSIFAREGGAMAGNLYVEAALQDHVITAVDGISHVFMGTKPMMIDRGEQPALLKIRKDKQLEPGMYVRIRRGIYQGDLAQIEEVETDNVNVYVKLVPRLDYGLTEDVYAASIDPASGKRKRPITQRPPQKLFSEAEAKKKTARFLSRNPGLSKNSWTYHGKEYTDGLLRERFKTSALQTENVSPTVDEVSKFTTGAEDGTEELDLAALAATLKAGTASDYLPGDKVEIYKGEQKGVLGRAVSVYGEVVNIKVESGALRGKTVEAPIAELRKLFREGDHVKVIGGKYFDEVGMVVKIRDDRVTILTDSDNQEITIFSKDLREASDSGGTIGTSKYDLFDLVQLDAATVGCVIKVDRESVRVLDQNGLVRQLLPSNIPNKIERRQHAIATDRDGNEIKLEDTVREYGGEQKKGRVMHVHRNFIFVQDRERSQDAGVFITRSANVITLAANGRTGQIDLSKMNPALRNGGSGQSAGIMLPPQSRGRDQLIGKSVRIKIGPSKGLVGIVKDTTADNATVELSARNKKVQVLKDKLVLVHPVTGEVLPDSRGLTGVRPGGDRPPIGGPPRGFGAPTGGETPAYARATTGGRTPSWKADAAKTPAWTWGGGQTSYGGQTYGNQTSYGAGNHTSYGGGNQTSYGGGSVWGSHGVYGDAGSKTPAYVSGSRTPGGPMDAPTPGFNAAPTPYDYATPGGRQYQTPAGYQPETPAPFADTPANDGPGYD